ncbi:MAG: hypothetical protein WDA68_10815, partial [Phycisphaerae bacterium]
LFAIAQSDKSEYRHCHSERAERSEESLLLKTSYNCEHHSRILCVRDSSSRYPDTTDDIGMKQIGTQSDKSSANAKPRPCHSERSAAK